MFNWYRPDPRLHSAAPYSLILHSFPITRRRVLGSSGSTVAPNTNNAHSKGCKADGSLNSLSLLGCHYSSLDHFAIGLLLIFESLLTKNQIW